VGAPVKNVHRKLTDLINAGIEKKRKKRRWPQAKGEKAATLGKKVGPNRKPGGGVALEKNDANPVQLKVSVAEETRVAPCLGKKEKHWRSPFKVVPGRGNGGGGKGTDPWKGAGT